MPAGVPARPTSAARIANLAIGLLGAGLLLAAFAAGHGWTDRHFLPSFALSRAFQVGLVDALRIVLALLGLVLLLLVRPRIVRAVAAGRGRTLLFSTLSYTIAVAAAFAAAEGILHTRTWHTTQESWGKEPLRQRDAELGWTFVPDHRGQAVIDGRTIAYATDRFGSRTGGAPLDPAQPTILVAGESIMFGYGLEWSETIPAQIQTLTGVQTANLAVNAYAADQIYLRLRRELPRFRRPVAVVIPFVPMLFDRELDRDRPHLDGNLRWHEGEPPSLRLVELTRRLLRYRSTAAIDEGVARTQTIVRATIALARSRGAAALIVVPVYQPEEPAERAIRTRVLDEGHIPYLLVPLDPAWRLQIDRHPNPRGAQAIAAAISRALGRQRSLPS